MGIKLEVFEDRLIFTTSNTDIAIQTVIEDESLEVTAPGRVVIPGKYLIDIVRKISSNKIEMNLIENKILVIKADRSEFKLHVMDVEDYPDVDFLDSVKPLNLDSKTLKAIIKETNYATSVYEKTTYFNGC